MITPIHVIISVCIRVQLQYNHDTNGDNSDTNYENNGTAVITLIIFIIHTDNTDTNSDNTDT